MEVVGIGGDCEILGDESVVGVFRRSHYIDITKEACLLNGIGCPCACVEIPGFCVQQVIWNHTELHACTATEEKYVIAFGDFKQFLHEDSSFFNYCGEFFAAVRDFED